MKADRNDAPSYLRHGSLKRSAKIWGKPAFFGTCVALGLLQVGSFLLLQSENLDQPRTYHPEIIPVAEINNSRIINDQGNRPQIVAERPRQNNLRTSIQAATFHLSQTTSKQTVFDHHNYVPRGADNAVSFRTIPEPSPPYQSPQQGVRVTIVGETQSMKDKTCWPWKEGSIERRNCKFDVGLRYRD